jgi:hypothetical protein
MLTSNDVTNGSLHVFGCGIYGPEGPELDGTASESALSNLSRLGHPVKHAQVPGGILCRIRQDAFAESTAPGRERTVRAVGAARDQRNRHIRLPRSMTLRQPPQCRPSAMNRELQRLLAGRLSAPTCCHIEPERVNHCETPGVTRLEGNRV